MKDFLLLAMLYVCGFVVGYSHAAGKFKTEAVNYVLKCTDIQVKIVPNLLFRNGFGG